MVIHEALQKFLGFEIREISADTTVSNTKMCKIQPDELYVYLEQLSGTNNLVDGSRSTLLATVPITREESMLNYVKGNYILQS